MCCLGGIECVKGGGGGSERNRVKEGFNVLLLSAKCPILITAKNIAWEGNTHWLLRLGVVLQVGP